MPKGKNKDGTVKVRPQNSGRKKKDGRKVGPLVLATDVADILDKQPDKATYIEEAVRLKDSTA